MTKPNSKKRTQRPNDSSGGPSKRPVVPTQPKAPSNPFSGALDYLKTMPKDKYGIDAAAMKAIKKLLGGK